MGLGLPPGTDCGSPDQHHRGIAWQFARDEGANPNFPEPGAPGSTAWQAPGQQCRGPRVRVSHLGGHDHLIPGLAHSVHYMDPGQTITLSSPAKLCSSNFSPVGSR